MRDAPQSVVRGVLIAVLGALFTAVLWTLITGDAERGLTYGAIVLGVLLATAALERRRAADAAERASGRGADGAERASGRDARGKRRRRH
jgi:hypothetical protein